MTDIDGRSVRFVAGPGGTFGNTLESLHSAAEFGADTVELDVIWLPDAHLPEEDRAPLVIAHDWGDAARRVPLRLTEALDALAAPPLDRLEINLDIKLPGREEELVGALLERELVTRAMISTLEMYSLKKVWDLEPRLRRGWSYPKVSRDWTQVRWARLPMWGGLQLMRFRLPGLAAERLPKLGVQAMWVYHRLVTPRLVRICDISGVELIAWKPDKAEEIRELLELGVHGICSNDPRLFAQL